MVLLMHSLVPVTKAHVYKTKQSKKVNLPESLFSHKQSEGLAERCLKLGFWAPRRKNYFANFLKDNSAREGREKLKHSIVICDRKHFSR